MGCPRADRAAIAMANRTLGDLTVLELSQGIPDPYCGKLLAGLGARVINAPASAARRAGGSGADRERAAPRRAARGPGLVGRARAAPWRLSASPFRPSSPAPLLGEHNDHVYREILGLEREEYRALQEAAVISTEPLWSRA